MFILQLYYTLIRNHCQYHLKKRAISQNIRLFFVQFEHLYVVRIRVFLFTYKDKKNVGILQHFENNFKEHKKTKGSSKPTP